MGRTPERFSAGGVTSAGSGVVSTVTGVMAIGGATGEGARLAGVVLLTDGAPAPDAQTFQQHVDGVDLSEAEYEFGVDDDANPLLGEEDQDI